MPGAWASSWNAGLGSASSPGTSWGSFPTAAPSGFLEEKRLWKRRWVLLLSAWGSRRGSGMLRIHPGLLQEQEFGMSLARTLLELSPGWMIPKKAQGAKGCVRIVPCLAVNPASPAASLGLDGAAK